MEKKIILWDKLFRATLSSIAQDFKDRKVVILNEVQIGDEIRTRFKEQKELVNSPIQIWPEATWFDIGKASGFFVDRTIMSDEYAIYFPSKESVMMEIKKFNKEFFYDGPAIAIELKFMREQNCPYPEMLADYSKLHNIRKAMDHRFKSGFYKFLNSNIWRGVQVVGCSTEVIYANTIVRLKHKMILEKPSKEIFVFVFGPSKSEFIDS